MAPSEKEIINKVVLPGNNCFGCGHENEHGLRIEVFRNGNEAQLIGHFKPKAHMIGFPGITHGGAVYTAMDCLASWAPTILIPEIKAAWILRSAEMKYLRPAHAALPLTLFASIPKTAKTWKPIVVQTTVHNEKGILFVKGSFKVVPLSPEKLKQVAGIDRLPKNWQDLLGH